MIDTASNGVHQAIKIGTLQWKSTGKEATSIGFALWEMLLIFILCFSDFLP
ncbi:hypothetical protein N9Z53_03845 [Mariniblastus sp.]|nr:hypothetical protein [Mariniblastus sp.]MDB4372889.1 hypothetical protein [Mariniblastus sp.]